MNSFGGQRLQLSMEAATATVKVTEQAFDETVKQGMVLPAQPGVAKKEVPDDNDIWNP